MRVSYRRRGLLVGWCAAGRVRLFPEVLVFRAASSRVFGRPVGRRRCLRHPEDQVEEWWQGTLCACVESGGTAAGWTGWTHARPLRILCCTHTCATNCKRGTTRRLQSLGGLSRARRGVSLQFALGRGFAGGLGNLQQLHKVLDVGVGWELGRSALRPKSKVCRNKQRAPFALPNEAPNKVPKGERGE